MTRIILLSLSGAMIFAGFGAPFFLTGLGGYLATGTLLLGGSALFFIVDRKTKESLDNDSAWNRTMKADGDSLLKRDDDP